MTAGGGTIDGNCVNDCGRLPNCCGYDGACGTSAARTTKVAKHYQADNATTMAAPVDNNTAASAPAVKRFETTGTDDMSGGL